MLVRVRQFGETHHNLLAASKGGAEALATIGRAVSELGAHLDSESSAAQKEKEVKVAARDALVASLKAIGGTAQLIGRKTPGFQARFRLPKPSRQTDQALLSAGRTFCTEARTEKDAFLTLGMKDTFVEDLEQKIETFNASVLGHEKGKDIRTAAQAGITKVLSEALDAVKTLHVIIVNQLQDDPIAMAVWERDRTVEVPRRSRRTVTASDTPVVPMSVATPLPAAPAPASPAAASPAVASPAPASDRASTPAAVSPQAANAVPEAERSGIQPDADVHKPQDAGDLVGVGS